MKKNLFALLLALAMTVSLAACSGNTETTDEDTNAPAVEDTQPETETPDAETETPEMETETPDAETETPEVETEETTPEVEPEENTPAVKPEQVPETKPEEAAPSAPAAGNVDLNAFYESIAAAQGENWPFMMLAEGEMLDGFFPGLNGIATKQCYAYLPGISAVATEIVLVEVENAADVEAVKAILQARIDTQVDGGAWYPETIEGWQNNSRIVTNGNCIMMAVYPEVETIVSGFNGLFA